MKFDETLRKKEDIKLISLKNGVRLVLIPRFGLKTVTIEWFVKIGSKYEGRQEAGLSHFLEHMAFKGTSKRPSAKVINNEIDSRGASYNAGTGLEMTSYYIKTVRENINWAIDILSDILFDSKYDVDEIEKEKRVIIEEIKMYQDNPMMGLAGDFAKFLFDKSKIGCWDVSGSVNDIQKYTREDLLIYKKRHWSANDMVIAIAGDIGDIDTVVGEFESKLGKRELPLISEPVNLEVKWGEEKNMVKKRKDIDQGHIAVGVPALSSVDKKRYVLRLVELMLAGNSSSRLYQTIREDRGYSYYIHSISEAFLESGYLAVQTGVPQDKIDEVVKLIKTEMLQFTKTVDNKDLELAKQYMEGRIKMAMDKTDFWTQMMGSKLLLENRLENVEKMLNSYRMVTLEEIKEISSELFCESRFYTAVITK